MKTPLLLGLALILGITYSGLTHFLEKQDQIVEFKLTEKNKAEIISLIREEMSGEIKAEIEVSGLEINKALINFQEEMNQKSLERQKTQVEKYKAEIYEDKDDIIKGNPEGSIVIVEFLDTNCFYCGEAHPVIKKILSENPEIKLIEKQLPFLKGSFEGSIAVLAAKRQGLNSELLNHFFKEKGSSSSLNSIIEAAGSIPGLDVEQLKKDMKDQDIINHVNRNKNVAREVGISGTPAFILKDDIINGYLPYDEFLKRINNSSK